MSPCIESSGTSMRRSQRRVKQVSSLCGSNMFSDEQQHHHHYPTAEKIMIMNMSPSIIDEPKEYTTPMDPIHTFKDMAVQLRRAKRTLLLSAVDQNMDMLPSSSDSIRTIQSSSSSSTDYSMTD
jgi:hypothetical protein